MWRELMQFILNNLSKVQRKASPSERRLLSSWLAGLRLLLKLPAGRVTTLRAIQICWILHQELIFWEKHGKPGVPVFGEMVKKGVPSRQAPCVGYKSPESDWDTRGEVASQKGNVEDDRRHPLQTHPGAVVPGGLGKAAALGHTSERWMGCRVS